MIEIQTLTGWPSRFPIILHVGFFVLEYEDLSPGCQKRLWRPSDARGSGVPGTESRSGPQTLCVLVTDKTCQLPSIYFLLQRKEMGILIFKKQLDLKTLS